MSRIRFGGDFELDVRSYELRRSGRLLKLERIPSELLLMLIEQRGQLVSRGQIVERIWGKDVFLDTDNSINAAVRKIRQVLKDDPEQPKFVQTITGRGYRFIATVNETPVGSERGSMSQTFAETSFSDERLSHRRDIQAADLPLQRTGFVGREKEVSGLSELLLRPDVRLVTVTGPGGIGKTRLAVRVAAELSESFPGGVYFVALSTLRDPGLVPSVIAQALGTSQSGGHTPIEILRKRLRESYDPLLVILDNFEHVVEAVPVVAELLTVNLKLKMLVTSRSVLHVYGEQEFPVPSLQMPDSSSNTTPETISQFSAISLFVQRALSVKPDFILNRENAQAVAEICIRLDGLPLAIELAAARVKVLSPLSMQSRLASRLQLLTGGALDLPRRQQTLRDAITWSYDLLSPAEQCLFRRLAVFVGGCSLEGVEAVCNTKGDLGVDPLDGMTSLVDKSLVQQTAQKNGESRFAMLETIREYAVERLAVSGEDADTRRCHAAYCLVLAEEAAGEQAGNDWFQLFSVEHDNLRAGLDWLTETENADWGLRLGAAMFRYWETCEDFAEGKNCLNRLLRLPSATAPTAVRARVAFAAGVFASEQGDYAEGEAFVRESLEISFHLGYQQGAAVALNALAVLARDRGDVEAACPLYEESLLLWRELGDQKAIARTLSNLANVVQLQGDYPRAHALYGECLDIFRELDDRVGVAWSLNYCGDVAREQRDFAHARVLYEQGLAIFQELGDLWGIAATLADLGSLSRQQRDYPEADRKYGKSIRIFQELGHKRGIARLLECFACSAASQKESSRALRLAGAASALRARIGAPLNAAEQMKLEASLEHARRGLTPSQCQVDWHDGQKLEMSRAVEEALLPHSASAAD